MKTEQKKEYIDGLNKILKTQNDNLSQEDKELIISVREGIKHSRSKTERLEWFSMLVRIFTSFDFKDLL